MHAVFSPYMLLTTTRRGTRLPTWTFIYVLIRDWAFGAQNQIPQHGRSVLAGCCYGVDGGKDRIDLGL
jgi:hypothetical protein